MRPISGAALLPFLHIPPTYMPRRRLPSVHADASTFSIDGAKLGPSGLLRGRGADLARLRERAVLGAGRHG